MGFLRTTSCWNRQRDRCFRTKCFITKINKNVYVIKRGYDHWQEDALSTNRTLSDGGNSRNELLIRLEGKNIRQACFLRKIQSQVSEGDKEKSDDGTIEFCLTSPSCEQEQEGLLTAAGGGRIRLLRLIKGGRSPHFIPNRSEILWQTSARTAPPDGQTDQRKVGALFSWPTLFLMKRSFYSAFILFLTQMQRCFGVFCVTLIFCATLSETIGLVIAVSFCAVNATLSIWHNSFTLPASV